MALGILMIFFIFLIFSAITIQILLYIQKNESKNAIFIINMLFGVFLSFLAFTALPMNYTEQRVIAIAWGVIAVLAMVVKFKNTTASKVMFSIAIVGSLVQLFL